MNCFRGFLSLSFFLFTLGAQAKDRSWFALTHLGYARPNYPSPLQEALTANRERNGVNNYPLEISGSALFSGFPLRLLVGPALTATWDGYRSNDASSSLQQYNLSASSLYFFATTERGFFLRTELGASLARASNSYGLSTTSNPGPSALLGGGYVIPVSSVLSVPLCAGYRLTWIEGGYYTTLSLSTGIFF